MAKIFVFGSNLAGRHGKGAALYAKKNHAARHGQGIGLQGSSYAIPTKGYNMQVLSLPTIQYHVQRFIGFARTNPALTFQVTRIGCGLAGYRDEEIAPMFRGAPPNCNFPEEWQKFL